MVEVFHRVGAGCLTHMWFAMDLRTRIRVYVDGEKTPSIDMAQDLGHGYAYGGPPEPWGACGNSEEKLPCGFFGFDQFNDLRAHFHRSHRKCVSSFGSLS